MVPSLEERFPQINTPRPNVGAHRVDWPKGKFQPSHATFKIGKTTVTCFTFHDAGNVLPMHSHPEGEAHLTFIAEGRLRIFGEGWERIVETGEQLVFPPDLAHAYEALSDGAKITNVVY